MLKHLLNIYYKFETMGLHVIFIRLKKTYDVNEKKYVHLIMHLLDCIFAFSGTNQ